MFKTLANAFKVKEIRNRIIFTFIMLIVVRIGSILPIPGVNTDYFTNLFNFFVSLETFLAAAFL